jgi:hypothetical protein
VAICGHGPTVRRGVRVAWHGPSLVQRYGCGLRRSASRRAAHSIALRIATHSIRRIGCQASRIHWRTNRPSVKLCDCPFEPLSTPLFGRISSNHSAAAILATNYFPVTAGFEAVISQQTSQGGEWLMAAVRCHRTSRRYTYDLNSAHSVLLALSTVRMIKRRAAEAQRPWLNRRRPGLA